MVPSAHISPLPEDEPPALWLVVLFILVDSAKKWRYGVPRMEKLFFNKIYKL